MIVGCSGGQLALSANHGEERITQNDLIDAYTSIEAYVEDATTFQIATPTLI